MEKIGEGLVVMSDGEIRRLKPKEYFGTITVEYIEVAGGEYCISKKEWLAIAAFIKKMEERK